MLRHGKCLSSLLIFTGLASHGFGQDHEVAVTIYNSNLALVRDVRQIELSKGRSEIKFQDVAAQIDPTSVYFTSLTSPEDVAILEQNFEYDLVNSAKILQKYVDQEIRLSTKQGGTFTGQLLSGSGQDVILQEMDGGVKIISRSTVDNIAFPKLPQGLITRPTLVWLLDCRKAGNHRTEVGYLTGGIQWHAEYVGVVDENDTQLELAGWVSIDNKSGATYDNATLKLVAGDVHRATQKFRRTSQIRAQQFELSSAPDGFQEKSFFEYHLYTLQRRATVANNQVKQISLFPATDVKVEKKYAYDGARDARKVRVNLEFENREKDGLGMPLPGGKVRAYKQDDDEALIFLGEDFVDHTPKDETVRLTIGNAFDLVGERKQMNRKSIGQRTWEESWEIKLRNHKKEAVQITVIERFGMNWEVIRKSHDFQQKDANTVEFAVDVPRDGETAVSYTVRYNR